MILNTYCACVLVPSRKCKSFYCESFRFFFAIYDIINRERVPKQIRNFTTVVIALWRQTMFTNG